MIAQIIFKQRCFCCWCFGWWI